MYNDEAGSVYHRWLGIDPDKELMTLVLAIKSHDAVVMVADSSEMVRTQTGEMFKSRFAASKFINVSNNCCIAVAGQGNRACVFLLHDLLKAIKDKNLFTCRDITREATEILNKEHARAPFRDLTLLIGGFDLDGRPSIFQILRDSDTKKLEMSSVKKAAYAGISHVSLYWGELFCDNKSVDEIDISALFIMLEAERLNPFIWNPFHVKHVYSNRIVTLKEEKVEQILNKARENKKHILNIFRIDDPR